MIRVCVVDDQTLVREGIKSLLGLASDIAVVGEASDGDEALRLIADTAPDVVLLDIRMPGRSGLEVLSVLNERGQLPPTMILTTFDDDEVVFEGLRAGARGYLLKDVSLERLLEAIRVLAQNGTLVQPALTERLLRSLSAARPVAKGASGSDQETYSMPAPSLTERETEILRLLAGGYSNREIADGLSVSEGTVKNHVSNILAKLEVRDRTRAVLKAIELGVI